MHTAIFSSSNMLTMQLLSPKIDALTDDEIAIALQQEWDDGAASTVVASEVMHNPEGRVNQFNFFKDLTMDNPAPCIYSTIPKAHLGPLPWRLRISPSTFLF
jgi:hypothetical protein